jgi:hypothetical protein
MSSSASAIADELVTELGEIAGVGAANSTKSDYGILERATSQFCMVVRPASGDNNWGNFGTGDATPMDTKYTFLVHGFVRELDDPVAYMNAQYTLINDVQAKLNAQQTLNGTCEYAMLARWEVPDLELNINGAIWQEERFWVECLS